MESTLCPCGTPLADTYFWHRLTNHDCIHHAERMAGCAECMVRGMAAKLITEVERWLLGEVA